MQPHLRIASLVLLATGALAAPRQEYGWTDEEHATLFGYEVAAIGDIDRDGLEDLAVAAPLAWCPEGRRGSVLIISTRSGKLLARLDGWASDVEFGWGIQCMKRAERGNAPTLSVDWSAQEPRAFGPAGSRLWAIDLEQPLEPLSVSWAWSWTPGDFDGDGVADVFGYDAKSKVYRWYSGASRERFDVSPVGGHVRVLGCDWDGDGLLDYLQAPGSGETQVALRSIRTGNRLSRFELGSEASYSYSTGIRGGLQSDGLPCLLFNVLDRDATTAQFCAFSARTGKLVRAAAPVTRGLGDERCIRFSLLAAPDLDGDGIEDFLSARTPSFRDELSAHSGRTLERLWTVERAIDDEHHSVAFLESDASPGNRSRFLLAVGRVHAVRSMNVYDTNGEVVLIDPVSGQVLRRLHEREYPQIACPAEPQNTPAHK